jgi:hypothetical protein
MGRVFMEKQDGTQNGTNHLNTELFGQFPNDRYMHYFWMAFGIKKSDKMVQFSDYSLI